MLQEHAEIIKPSEEDFQNVDLNEDGTLLFEEWEEWAKQESAEEIVEESSENKDP